MSTEITQVDQDPVETQEWLEALSAVIEHEGVERAHYIRGQSTLFPQYRLCEYHTAAPAGQEAWRPVSGTEYSFHHSLECPGHGGQG